jgi:hypothetical protein
MVKLIGSIFCSEAAMSRIHSPSSARLPLLALSCVCTASGAALAADPDLAVTIYTSDLALIQDHRTLDLAGGRQRIEFQNVSARIRPETVSLSAGNALSIVEQNFDYDLLTPGKLMEKAVGQNITLVRTNPATGEETRVNAQVLATNGGVILKIGDRIEVLRDDGLPARVIFEKVPDNLRARPTLSVTVNGTNRGSVPATLSYLTPGLGWRADYVALYNQTSSKIDVQGWVTLSNRTGTTFDNARTLLVAGAPNTASVSGGRSLAPPSFSPAGSPLVSAGTESGSRERLGDYYLYPLAERTTIADQQTKQVSFLDVHGIPAEHAYEFRNNWLGAASIPLNTQAVYRFTTRAQAGLGDQLPAGTLRFYMSDARGESQFIGESGINHTPMGSVLSLSTGDAFDIKVQPTVEKRSRLGRDRWQTDMRYVLTNAMPQAVTVTVLQSGLVGDTVIRNESLKSTRRSADVAEWAVEVPANGTATLTASFDTRF